MESKKYSSRISITRSSVFRHSALSDVAILHAVYNFVLCVCVCTNVYWKGKKKKSFKNLGPAAVPVPYKNQRIAWMDSEIVRVHFLKMNLRIVEHFP